MSEDPDPENKGPIEEDTPENDNSSTLEPAPEPEQVEQPPSNPITNEQVDEPPVIAKTPQESAEDKKRREKKAQAYRKQVKSDKQIAIEKQFCFAKAELLIKVLKAIDFKGGESSLDSLKVALMLDVTTIRDGLDTAVILKFLTSKEGKEFEITQLTPNFLSGSLIEQQQILGKSMLELEAYRDVIFRMKMTPGKSMNFQEIDKAIYILLPNVREELRLNIRDAFIDLAKYANLIEDHSSTGIAKIHLTTAGEKQLDEIMQAIKRKRKGLPEKGGMGGSRTITCNACGKPILADYAWCPYCAVELKANCAQCGKELQPDWKLCPYCGSAR